MENNLCLRGLPEFRKIPPKMDLQEKNPNMNQHSSLDNYIHFAAFALYEILQ